MQYNRLKDWSVYILQCRDGSLYTGITKDVPTRVRQHNKGKGGAYTRSRLPVKRIYQEDGLTHYEALVREAEIKRLPRIKKEAIISEKNGEVE